MKSVRDYDVELTEQSYDTMLENYKHGELSILTVQRNDSYHNKIVGNTKNNKVVEVLITIPYNCTIANERDFAEIRKSERINLNLILVLKPIQVVEWKKKVQIILVNSATLKLLCS